MQSNAFYMGAMASSDYYKHDIHKPTKLTKSDFIYYKMLDTKDDYVIVFEGDYDEAVAFLYQHNIDSALPDEDIVITAGDYIVHCIYDDETHKAHKIEVSLFHARLSERYINDLKEEYCPSDMIHLFDTMYSEAWDRGHSAGYDEVTSYFTGIVDTTRRMIGIHEIHLKENGWSYPN